MFTGVIFELPTRSDMSTIGDAHLVVCIAEIMYKSDRHFSTCNAVIDCVACAGTFELGDEEQEEIYEVINIGKIKAHTPNLRVINLYGISFVDDSHVEMLSSNCIHLESLSLSFCLKVNGSSMKNLIHRCKKLKTLLLQHCSM